MYMWITLRRKRRTTLLGRVISFRGMNASRDKRNNHAKVPMTWVVRKSEG